MRSRLSALCLCLLGACTNLPPSIKNFSATNIPYQLIREDINSYQGIPVRWGGTVINVENETELSLVQILFYPLDRNAYPQTSKVGEGRFVVETEEFLDPAIFAVNTKITIVGTLKGETERMVGKRILRIPQVSAEAIYLWPEEYRGNRYYGEAIHRFVPEPYFGGGYCGPYWCWW